MRARTLLSLSLVFVVALPLSLHAAAPILSQQTGSTPPYTVFYGFPALNNSHVLVATGTLDTFSGSVAAFHALTGTEKFSLKLENYYLGLYLDCQTPEKTADEWGITHLAKDPNAPVVTFGPFTGTACSLLPNTGTNNILVVPFRNGVADPNFGMMGTNDFVPNFTAYGPDVAPPVSPPPPPAPAASSVLFLPGTEASRLYYRDADGLEQQLWEPTISGNIPLLAMNADGTSVHQVYTKDIMDSLYRLPSPVAHLSASNLEVYGDFEHFMDGLVASTTLGMHEWRAYPYDWRFDVRDVVTNGTLTEEPNGSLEQVYLEDVVAQMAASSNTGKVTIIAHSNGGLLAKALMIKLAADGKAGLVDQLVMVGTPQWGTPVDIGSMLHGDSGSSILPIVLYGDYVRKAAATMPGPYDLLPSASYFAHVADPVATFATDDIAGSWQNHFPSGIHSLSDLTAFVTDAFSLDASVGTADEMRRPLALSGSLVSAAATTQNALNAWTPPASLKVTAIAGWGQLTTYSYSYAASLGHTVCETLLGKQLCGRENTLIHTALKTEDGDDTVVAASAAGNIGDVWYFDSKQFQKDTKQQVVHQDLTSSVPVQNAVTELLEGMSPEGIYIKSIKPIAAKNPITIISGRSPVNIVATDASGNETGIVPVPGTTGIYFAKHDIPGSAVSTAGDDKSVTLPQGTLYSLTVTGYDAGLANIVIENMDATGSLTSSTTLADIPVTTSTVATFSLGSSGVLSSVAIDLDGDGTTDQMLTPVAGDLVAYPSPPGPSATDDSSASVVVGGGAGGSGTIQSLVIPTISQLSASLTPGIVLPPIAPVATSAPTTSSSSSSSSAVGGQLSLIPKKTLVLPRATHASPSSNAPAADFSQTAAAYSALSSGAGQATFVSVYHWMHTSLHNLIHTFSHLL